MVAKAVLELVDVLSKQGHSGFSASMTLAIFDRVARFKPLTPLTSSPDEWNEIGDGHWQSRRCPSVFSYDGGKTWYDIDDNMKQTHMEEVTEDATS